MSDYAAPAVDASSAARRSRAWHPVWKAAVSLLLLFHIASMLISSYCSAPASPLAYKVFAVCGPYAQAMYVHHGYRFFSPEPGASTLIEFQSLLHDGSTRSETIPNRGEGGQWPRVFYHRHFMLTEYLSAVSDQPQLFDAVVESYASHYLAKHPEVREVTLVQVVHLLATPEFVRAGGDLLHESTFVREPLGTFRWDSETSAAVRVDAAGESIPAPLPAAQTDSVTTASAFRIPA
jgi:hypothetical protein